MLSLPFIYSFASCNILTIVLTIADLLNTCRISLRDFFIVTITINHPQMIFSFQIVFLSLSLSSSCHLFNFQLPSFLLIFFYLTTQCHSKKIDTKCIPCVQRCSKGVRPEIHELNPSNETLTAPLLVPFFHV